VTQVLEIRGLDENHYDYEEPVFLPPDSIRVFAQDQNWKANLTRHLEKEHPDLIHHRLLRVPNEPWDSDRLIDDPIVILKANRGVKGALPEVGDIIDGTFRIERSLGAGAAGSAFEVSLTRNWRELVSGRTMCLKWYKDEIFTREPKETAIHRRIREAVVGGAVDHPNLARVYDATDFWIAGKPQFLLLDLIEGETLEVVAHRESVSSDRAQRLLLDIAHGIKALHNQRILHRDVKAANVMVSPDGRAVLLDLGVVRPQPDATMTASQTFLGTTRFAAPEWLVANECTTACDVYSLGTIAYHLLTGEEIFKAVTNWARVVNAVQTQKPYLSRNGWDLNRQCLGNLTERMLAKQPQERPTLDEVIDVLQNAPG